MFCLKIQFNIVIIFLCGVMGTIYFKNFGYPKKVCILVVCRFFRTIVLLAYIDFYHFFKDKNFFFSLISFNVR